MVAAVHPTPDTLVTTYLHMTDPAQFRPAFTQSERVRIFRMERADVHFYRFLYGEVGRQWRWRDRLVISEEELLAAISDPRTSIFVMYVDGVPAGYVELYADDDHTEIAYFGLRSQYHGMGLGKHLLSFGIDQAWKSGARRVWLHTCNLDSPHALDNYLKRGFSVIDIEKKPMPSRYV